MMVKDKGFSWVIALACCFLNCLMYGVTRLSGLLLVSTVETFHVSRARAAIPFSVSTSVRNLSGIFVGYLGQKFGLRIVISTGCLLASIGAGFCFFASDVFWVTIFWGGLFGIGCGFATCLLPLAINDHFEKHRGTALGISYSGSYIGSFIFPPIVVLLIDTYGLPGAFLVISASLLNGLAASLLFKTKPSKAEENNNFQTPKDKESKFPCRTSDSHNDRKNYYKIIWRQFLYQLKKISCLLQSIEFTYGQHQPQIHLTSAAALKGEEENSECIPSELFSVVSKPVEEKRVYLLSLLFGNKKIEDQALNNHPGDFYFNCKSTSFSLNSKAKSKKRNVNLRKIDFVRFFKKRYSFNVYSIQLPKEDVKLVSIKNENGSFYSATSRKKHHCHTHLHYFNKGFTSDNMPDGYHTSEKDISLYTLPNKDLNNMLCISNLETQNSEYKSHSELCHEFVSKQTTCNCPCKLNVDAITAYTVCMHAPDTPNFCKKQDTDSSITESHLDSCKSLVAFLRGKGVRSEIHGPDSSIIEIEETAHHHPCPHISDISHCIKDSKTDNSNDEFQSDSASNSSTIPQTQPNKTTTTHDFSTEGTCISRISSQDHNHVSNLPSANTPASNKLEDSKPCLSCPSSENIHAALEDSKHFSKKRVKIPPIKSSPLVKNTAKCCFGWFRMYADPMFVVITTTMSLHTFVVVCMITIIEDFAKDIHVPENQVHCVLMALSIADLLAALTLGVVTDRQLMSGCHFVVLCFSGTGACILAISYSHNLPILLTLVSIYGIFETGVVITLPLLISQFIEVKKQAIALAASNILSSPTVMLVPLVIGYFRDNIGCYSGVFYVLGITSFVSSLIWLLAPYLISKYRCKQKIGSEC